MRRPRFHPEQWVQFIGGEGRIKDFYPDSGTWTYAVEMALNPELSRNRIGDETTILLQEADLLPLLVAEVPLVAAAAGVPLN